MSSAEVKHPDLTIAFLIAVSIFGLVLSTFFVLFPFPLEDDFAFRNLIVGSAFSMVCILGMFAALFPGHDSTIFKFRKSKAPKKRRIAIHETTYRAHHPICENYSTHILSIGKMKFCATCSGLLLGAAFVLVSTSLYFFVDLRLAEPVVLVWLGVAGVTLGFAQSALPNLSNGLTRFVASILFVVGTFLMLVSVDEAAKSISVDLFFVALSVLWILTKIGLSQRDHQRTCSHCSKDTCRYKKTQRQVRVLE